MLRFFVGQNLPAADNFQSLIAEKSAALLPGDHNHTNMEGATLNIKLLLKR